MVLLSTMHSNMSACDDEKKKPEIGLDYNKYKVGIGALDQMLCRCTTQRRTNRGPLAFFWKIVDISCLAIYIIYFENNVMVLKRFLRLLNEKLTLKTDHKTNKLWEISVRRLQFNACLSGLMGYVGPHWQKGSNWFTTYFFTKKP